MSKKNPNVNKLNDTYCNTKINIYTLKKKKKSICFTVLLFNSNKLYSYCIYLLFKYHLSRIFNYNESYQSLHNALFLFVENTF